MANAEKAIDGVTTWAALEKAVRNFAHCDQGQASEMFNEAMLRVLIGGWPNVAEAEPLLEGNAAFKAWISKRLVNPAIHKDDIDSVRGLAKSSCPSGRARLCEYFKDAVDANKPIVVPNTIEFVKPADPSPKK